MMGVYFFNQLFTRKSGNETDILPPFFLLFYRQNEEAQLSVS